MSNTDDETIEDRVSRINDEDMLDFFEYQKSDEGDDPYQDYSRTEMREIINNNIQKYEQAVY